MRGYWIRVLSLSAVFLVHGQAQAQWSLDPTVNTPVCTATNDQEAPVIVGDGAGGTIIAWQDYRSGINTHVYAQRFDASGVAQWTTNGIDLCTAPGDHYSPLIVSDGAGGAIVAWWDYRAGNLDLYAQRINASGVLQWGANGAALCTDASNQADAFLSSDGIGGAIIAWDDSRSGVGIDIYAQRINASGVVQWTTDGAIISTGMAFKIHPTSTSDGAGGAIIAWQDGRSGTDDDIYAQSINAGGAVQWAINGVAICTAKSDQTVPQITSDGSSGALITWEDLRNGTTADVYAQRINSAGVVQWTADGVPLCTAAGRQSIPAITGDGASGAIVTWEDYRTNDTSDVYAQRVNATGVVQWPTNGVALSTAPNRQDFPSITSDGSGGAIVAWVDRRSGTNSDIYAQRINATGDVQWTANGVAVSVATNNQFSQAINGDGAGGAIVTWTDLRSGNRDVYVQDIPTDGILPIELASFTAQPEQNGHGVLLNWNTISETNNYGFEVQRSRETDTAFVTLPNSFVPGHGTTNVPQHYAFIDSSATSARWFYRLRQIDLDQTVHVSATVAISTLTGVAQSTFPDRFALLQNYPDPFNPSTKITYQLPAASHITLQIYNAIGQEVATLVDGVEDAGYKSVVWNAQSMASGVYFYRIAATAGHETFMDTKRMLVLK